MSHSECLFVGVDVGTGSVRALLSDENGRQIRIATRAIRTWSSSSSSTNQIHREQSSQDIWKAVVATVRNVTENVAEKEKIKGIGFCATCSLVALGLNGQPKSISLNEDNDETSVRNVILWNCHRAQDQAERINATKHEILKFVGGRVSAEMEMPKILWIKENLGLDSYGSFMDLCDFLSFKATNSKIRSTCALVCKWNWMGWCDSLEEKPPLPLGWNKEFLDLIGLSELSQENFEKIGNVIQEPGEPIGDGLCREAAKELGLTQGTSVSTSLIDAHCGALGMLGHSKTPIQTTLAIIAGTSSCTMGLSKSPNFPKGIWGPYANAVVPSFFATEGGLSAAGQFLDFIIETHPAKQRIPAGTDPHDLLVQMLMKNGEQIDPTVTRNLHMTPDINGNRRINSELLSISSGIGLTDLRDNDLDNLSKFYLAAIQSIGLATRAIIHQMNKSGFNIKQLVVGGGISKNKLFLQTLADCVSMPVVVPISYESVLIGGVILASAASKHFSSIEMGMEKINGSCKFEEFLPNPRWKVFYERKFKVFRLLEETQEEIQKEMKV